MKFCSDARVKPVVSLWDGTLGCQASRGVGRWRVERGKLVEVLGPQSEPPVCLGSLRAELTGPASTADGESECPDTH